MAMPVRRGTEILEAADLYTILDAERINENQFRVQITHDLGAVLQASEMGNVDSLVKALHYLRGSIDQADEDGNTALHLACLNGNMSCVQVLLERRARLDSRDEDGAIPLHDACSGGFTKIVQALLDTAENEDRIKRLLDTTDIDGDTPLHHAARGNHLEVVQLLLHAGASPNVENISSKTPADLADPDTQVKWVLDTAARANSCS